MIHLLLLIIYLAFISLGLPDALLGSAWPIMHTQFQVPISFAGMISMIIALGTIISSLKSDYLTKKLGVGKVTAISVALTALALLGFTFSSSFLQLCLWAIPYGLGAGSVDAALNNYVALHYESRHMSWLHCMWGIGASLGPVIMGLVLSNGYTWNNGYLIIAALQIILTFILIINIPLWKASNKVEESKSNTLSLKAILKIPGAKEILVTFFCYCAIESTVGLWASSYLVEHKLIHPQTAATFASLFYIGITLGRFVNGFVTMKLSDSKLIKIGQGIILIGVCLFYFPNNSISLLALILIGLGCAPIYPCIIHSTPILFGEDNSQALIGVQMASAYIGSCLMPPFFGWLASIADIALYPYFIFVLLVFMINKYQRCLVKIRKQ